MSRCDPGHMETIQTTLDSTLQTADKAEELVMKEAAKLGLEEDDQHQVGMAVRECTVNAVVHGNRYNQNKRVHLQIERSDKDLTVVIGDEGGFRYEFAARSAGAGEFIEAIGARAHAGAGIYG